MAVRVCPTKESPESISKRETLKLSTMKDVMVVFEGRRDEPIRCRVIAKTKRYRGESKYVIDIEGKVDAAVVRLVERNKLKNHAHTGTHTSTSKSPARVPRPAF